MSDFHEWQAFVVAALMRIETQQSETLTAVQALQRDGRRVRRRRLTVKDLLLLDAIWRSIGSVSFTCVELVMRANVEDAPLLAGLVAAGADSPMRLGRRLHGLVTRCDATGYQVQRVSREDVGVLWVITQVDL